MKSGVLSFPSFAQKASSRVETEIFGRRIMLILECEKFLANVQQINSAARLLNLHLVYFII